MSGPFRGGQGHSAWEIERDGQALVTLAAGAFAGAGVVLVLWAATLLASTVREVPAHDPERGRHSHTDVPTSETPFHSRPRSTPLVRGAK